MIIVGFGYVAELMLSCLSFFLLLAVALSVDRGGNERQEGSLVFEGFGRGWERLKGQGSGSTPQFASLKLLFSSHCGTAQKETRLRSGTMTCAHYGTGMVPNHPLSNS